MNYPRLVNVHSFWHDDIIKWLDDRNIKWIWKIRENDGWRRTEFLITGEENALAFKLRWGDNGFGYTL